MNMTAETRAHHNVILQYSQSRVIEIEVKTEMLASTEVDLLSPVRQDAGEPTRRIMGSRGASMYSTVSIRDTSA